jgi:hypothetical protein
MGKEAGGTGNCPHTRGGEPFGVTGNGSFALILPTHVGVNRAEQAESRPGD